MSDRTGIVLAGGRSERFGDRDKALATVGGTPMLARVVDRLGRVVGDVVVSCRADQRDTFADVLDDRDASIRFALDSPPDRGPLAGLATALAGVTTPSVAVAACDMPGIDPTFVAALFDRIGDADAAVPLLPSGHPQPALAAYRTAALRTAAERERDAGRRSLTGVLDHLDATLVTPDEIAECTDLQSLTNVNTPADLDSFER